MGGSRSLWRRYQLQLPNIWDRPKWIPPHILWWDGQHDSKLCHDNQWACYRGCFQYKWSKVLFDNQTIFYMPYFCSPHMGKRRILDVFLFRKKRLWWQKHHMEDSSCGLFLAGQFFTATSKRRLWYETRRDGASACTSSIFSDTHASPLGEI